MTAVLATPPFLAFQDADGNPLSGGFIYTYAAGTDTPKATFTTQAANIEQTNPIELDDAGRATWWINGAYKYVVKDSLGNTIATTDNVTSFNTLAEAEDAFFQSFSGTGSQTAFTLSDSLGTDSKGLMIFLNRALQSCVTNGTFATDTGWTKGSGWTIGSGVATATGAISTAISQTSPVTLVEGQAYAVTYVVTRSAGGLIPSIGGTSGVERTASGTYQEIIIAGSSQTIAFTGNAFTGTLDTVTINVASTAGFDILNPSAYTVNGTALTFASAPAPGTNNIFVFAPSTLLGAASASAALAEGYAAAAAASAVEAADAVADATKLSGTSVTSNSVATGSKSFTTQSGKYFGVGSFVLITSDADTTNYMHGQVTSYASTSLVVNVIDIGGSGTYTDWTIRVSGTQGPEGTVADGSITNAKLADMTASKIKARSSTTGAPQDSTISEVLDFLSTTSGAIPLRGASTWGSIVYEEGSWTPTIQGSVTPGTQTYSSNVGRYITIGNMVTAWCRIVMTAKDGATSGNLQIAGLPATASSVTGLNYCGSVLFGSLDINTAGGYSTIAAQIGSGASVVSLVECGDNVAAANLTDADLQATTTIIATFVYRKN